MTSGPKLRTAFRIGVLVTLICAVGAFILLWWVRVAIVPADNVALQVLAAAGGGLFGGFLSCSTGFLAAKLWWKRHAPRDSQR
jgi:hypothetical protein